MNARQAKQFLWAGLAAIVLAVLLELLNTAFIAATPLIILSFALLGGGVICVFVGLAYYIMNPIRRSS